MCESDHTLNDTRTWNYIDPQISLNLPITQIFRHQSWWAKCEIVKNEPVQYKTCVNFKNTQTNRVYADWYIWWLWSVGGSGQSEWFERVCSLLMTSKDRSVTGDGKNRGIPWNTCRSHFLWVYSLEVKICNSVTHVFKIQCAW